MTMPPPYSDAIDGADALKRLHERGERLLAAFDRFGLDTAFQEGRELLPALLATRIGLLGSMILYMPAVGRYLRDLGLAVELRPYGGEHAHFLPEADHIRPDDALPARDLNWYDIITPTPADIARSVGPYGFVIANGRAPAFFARLGRPLDLFIPYGSDFYEIPFLWTEAADFDQYRDINRLVLGHFQRIGIRQARLVQISNHQFLPRLEALGQERRVQRGVPMVYAPSYDRLTHDEALSLSPLAAKVAALRTRYSFLAFHHSRHYWETQTSPVNRKGNDMLLRGFAAFTRTPQGAGAGLITFEYGPDVDASRRLIAELGITDRVVWFPVSHRRDFMSALRFCDVATGQFMLGWRFSGALYEVIVAGVPLINHGDWSQNGVWPDRPYPYLQARTPEEIRDALTAVATDPGRHKARAREARRWYDDAVVEPFLGGVLRQFVDTVRERRAGQIHGELGAMAGGFAERDRIPIEAEQGWDAALHWARTFDGLPETVRDRLEDFITSQGGSRRGAGEDGRC